jgi:predicted MPP superfamily phosphohydrolase
LIFFAFFISLIGIYIGAHFSDQPSNWIVIGLMITALIVPSKGLLRWKLPITFAAIGFLNFFVILIIISDLILVSLGQSISKTFILFSSLSFCFIGFYKGKKGPVINHIILPISNLPSEFDGFRIGQISDLHIGAMVRQKYVQDVVEKINSTNCHVVTLTGDIGDGFVKDYREEIHEIKNIKSQYGQFYVPGNHEYYWNGNEWLGAMNNIGMINLVNRGKIIYHNNRPLLLAGVPDPVSRINPDLAGILELNKEDNPDFKILLSHRPGIAISASEAGFDLQLSGHTHGGQFFPWTIVVKWVHKIHKGLHKVGTMWIYVNQGTGSWGPQLRLGSQTEIAIITLKKETNQITSS